ncbi:MAG: NlpC/P60 family protein [Cyanobacteriota bacterium]|nr:NlpC/P60 family protein [Cyanobacteriota bacterium]
MATLGTARSPQLAPPLMGTTWRLLAPLDAYSRPRGPGLATQVAAGRHLRVVEHAADGPAPRLRVRLWEDGYPCWLAAEDLARHGERASPPPPRAWDRTAIEAALPAVLAFALEALAVPNRYLWGGTLGPDFDCSGLVQTAFARVGLWLPRDAYLQERFCQRVAVQPGHTSLLRPGDLIFFGTPQRCTHVGLHLDGGRYLHSSGQEHGRNGLGVDDLHPGNADPVASHYRLTLRGAGRVMHSHDGSPLPP